MINLTIAIDDVNPKKDWRIFGDKTEKYLFDLNKQFGAKFTLFKFTPWRFAPRRFSPNKLALLRSISMWGFLFLHSIQVTAPDRNKLRCC
jgi:hypothetical protein